MFDRKIIKFSIKNFRSKKKFDEKVNENSNFQNFEKNRNFSKFQNFEFSLTLSNDFFSRKYRTFLVPKNQTKSFRIFSTKHFPTKKIRITYFDPK